MVPVPSNDVVSSARVRLDDSQNIKPTVLTAHLIAVDSKGLLLCRTFPFL